MENPFQIKNYVDQTDSVLLEQSLSGDKNALNNLLKRHQTYIYNVAWKFVHNQDDAWDITQEVLIKAVTRLDTFKQESNFRTWLYRITFNHFLQAKKSAREEMFQTFDDFESGLEHAIKHEHDMDPIEEEENKDLIEEMKLRCTSGMLLCLSREQRLVYLLGDVFRADHNLGAELLDITVGTYRTRLSRARKDLYNFMQNKCGLVNKDNPCRCRKQTKFALENGLIEKGDLTFNLKKESEFRTVIEPISEEVEEKIDMKYAEIYGEHKFKSNFEKNNAIKEIIEDDFVKNLFDKF